MSFQRPATATRSHTAPGSPAARISIDALLNPSSHSPPPAEIQRMQRVSSFHNDSQAVSPREQYAYFEQDRYAAQNRPRYPRFSHSYEQHPSLQYHRSTYDNGIYSPSQEYPGQATDGSTRRSSSIDSSPGPRRERFPSISSNGSSAVHERRRPPRPKYDEEEMYFIWYHRVDLRQEWRDVRESFNAQFANRPRNGFQGIQCKYYRFIKEKKCPTLREQRRRRSESDGVREPGDNLPAYGVVRWTKIRYPWMRPADRAR
ncbi:component of the polarisome [Ascosphaera pollenicola]|nr:component of the polarisome [Ascosphaera pollenicola]